MKKLVVFAVAFCSCSAMFAEAKKPAAALTPEERAARIAAREQRVMEKSGGKVFVPGKGKVVVANCKGAFDLLHVADEIGNLKANMQIDIDVVNLDQTFTVADANALAKKTGGQVVVFFVEDPALPISIYAPEENWSAINIGALKRDGAASEKVVMRGKKMFARAVTLTLGKAYEDNIASPMQTVTSLDTLDKMAVDHVFVMDLNAMISHLDKLGVTRSRYTTYRRACQEGWAAQPTNKYQQAVWDEVHSIPKKPLKLEK